MKSCMAGGLQVVVLSFEFHQNRLSGFGAVGGRNLPFPVDLAIGLYNSLYYRTSRDGFRVLAALLHGTLVVGVSQTAALNRGRPLYSARRPSRWALTHILVCFLFVCTITDFSAAEKDRGVTFCMLV